MKAEHKPSKLSLFSPVYRLQINLRNQNSVKIYHEHINFSLDSYFLFCNLRKLYEFLMTLLNVIGYMLNYAYLKCTSWYVLTNIHDNQTNEHIHHFQKFPWPSLYLPLPCFDPVLKQQLILQRILEDAN